ncbi:LysR family transcriptional regulator [Streptomyces endophyticus]|uniref:LysR family transcriptional regulator n=1 Tax=Streptomyces endophyticus TaxID=714166 RepID=A0ABU6FG75_9ACTN|nr:LysR family transcriptional regulator [Streptomyces endophyticus]MEB8343043.1 LysR family transcriptional regulator [Streptomyces endophyticus]
MELRQLEQFLAVVDHGGLGRAAERLYLSQPTVSGSVRALERELKVELFHRTARRLVPTSAGLQLVPLARRVLDDVVAVQDAMRSAREVGGGVLTVMCTPDMSGEAVASWAGGFTRAYPAVRLDISEVGSRHELVAAVADGRAELGFTLAPDELRGDLDFIELGVQRLLLVRPPGHGGPGAGARRVPLAAIGDLPLARRQVTRNEEDAVQAALAAHGVDPTTGATVPSRNAQLTFVLRSGFQAFLPLRMCAAALDAGAEVVETDPLIESPFGVVHRAGELAPAAQQFVADVRSALRAWFDAIAAGSESGLGLVDAVAAAREAAL